MKKFLLIIILFIFPIFVMAEECTVINDAQTTDDRTLSCDSEEETVTTFETSKEETVIDNGVCTIECTESLIFSIDPIKKVLSGTSFNYPLYVSGERKCTATYDYETYETTISKLVSEYESLSGSAKTTKGNEIVNYYNLKKECDEFTVKDSDYENKYTVDGTVTLKVEKSVGTDNINYSYRDISEYYSNFNTDDVKYTSCEFDEATKTCTGGSTTISSWTETARIFGKYTMPNVYVERYTGDITYISSSTTCNAGDRYFVDFNELTKPLNGDTEDNGYKLTLTATNVGNNLVTGGDTWNLNVNCWYQVNNLSFPQGGEAIVTGEDENYSAYGNMAFVYRQIDLDDPFPDRDPGANWYGKENLISITKDNIDNMSEFDIILNRSLIKKIREYNESYPYTTFNLDEMEKSLFIINNPSIIDRK